MSQDTLVTSADCSVIHFNINLFFYFYLLLPMLKAQVLVINGTRSTIYNPLDSGLYVLFAMECDYFDSPVYAPDPIHWTTFRIRMAYCLLNKQLLLI